MLQPKLIGQTLHSRPCGRVRRVAVNVAGDADRTVSEQNGHRLDVHTGLKSRHGGTVPQGVDPDAFDASLRGGNLDVALRAVGG
jgi:hypothetical protein